MQNESDGTQRLAASLRGAWQESGLTLEEIVKRAGWFSSASYLSRAFRGDQTLSLSALKAVTTILDCDYRRLLEEAGFDEETYRSRYAKRATGPRTSHSSQALVRDILAEGLQSVRELKREGKPEEARGAIAEIERVVKVHLGGLPADRETVLTWAAVLCERVGIVQDVQLPHTVLPTASRDLDDILTIADEYDAPDLRAVGHFYAGDAHFKAEDYSGAIAHYEWSATHAPTPALGLRSLTGQAVSRAYRQRPDDIRPFRNLAAAIQEPLESREPKESPSYIWDSERWLLAELWSEETLGRALVVVGEQDLQRDAERALEDVSDRYSRATAASFVHRGFELSLARSRFVAACEGVFDMSEQDIRELGLQARRLAEEGSCLRTKREIEGMMVERFGFREWN